MSRVTVQNIADALGLSKFAVSRALAGKSGVSEDTRRLIIGKATELGYISRPPRAGNERRSIEIIFHDPDVAHRELWVEVQVGVQQECTRLGFDTTVRLTHDATLPGRLVDNTAGFILVGPQDKAMIDAARVTGIPCVRIGPAPHALYPMDQVGAADREAMAVVADHLLGLGHRTFVYVHGRPGYPGRIDRLQGFAAAVARTEGTSLRELSFPDDDKAGDFRALMEPLLAADFQPTAFFCGNDGVAVTVLSELLRLGIKVPEQVSVVGFADYPIATRVSPRLTTIHSPHREMGAAAVQIIRARMEQVPESADLPPLRLDLVGRLVTRESTAAASNGAAVWEPL